MGRLTLNVLLSFAQFEREVTGERIRDKIAASKRKGMWMGGLVPLGYELRDRQLTVVESEAATVRHIFQRYCELGSVRLLKEDLDRDGLRSKLRISSNGSRTGEKSFSRGALYTLLRNPIYVGEVRHKDARHPGQHQRIVERSVWERMIAPPFTDRLLASSVLPVRIHRATEFLRHCENRRSPPPKRAMERIRAIRLLSYRSALLRSTLPARKARNVRI